MAEVGPIAVRAPGVPPPVVGKEAPPATSRQLRTAFAVVCAGFAMTYMDMMIVNVAFPAIEHNFRGSTTAELSWTLNAYSIFFAALLVPFGRLADRFSRKNGFLLGMAAFTAGSALCAVAQGVPMLVAARVLQAAGAAALVPTALGLLLAAYPPQQRASAIRTLMAIGGVGVAIAPVIGGSLASVNWRWIFVINLPIGLICLLAGGKVLSSAKADDGGPLPDLLGSVLLIIAIGLITLGLVNAPQWGWTSARVLGSFAGTVVFTAVFVIRSARHPSPVISLALLRIRSFSLANLTSLLFAASFAAMLLSVVLWTQLVWGYSALRAGLALAPGALLMPPAASFSGRLTQRLGAAVVIALGCALLSAGIIWLAVTAQVRPDYLAMLLPGVILTLVGSVLGLATILAVVTKDLPPAAFSTGAAINTMIRQVGFVIGISVFIAVLGTPHSPLESKTAFQHGWLLAAAFGIAAAFASLLLLRNRLGPDSSSPEEGIIR